MEHNELYQRLGLPQQVVEALSEYGKTCTGSYLVKIEDLIADIGVMKGLEGKIKDFVGEDPDGFGMLWEELDIARKVFDEYQKRGICADIFDDTMKLCPRHCTSC